MSGKRLLAVKVDGAEVKSLPRRLAYVVAYAPVFAIYLVIACIYLFIGLCMALLALVYPNFKRGGKK